MSLKKVALGLGALALASAPAVAQMSMGPAVAPLNGDESELSKSSSIILGVLGAVVVVGAVIALTDDDEPQLPISG